MNADQHIWHGWAETLHRWGLAEWAAVLLNVAGPLSLIAAQVVYLSQPLLAGNARRDSLEALARMLEDGAEREEFIKLLREAPRCGIGA